MEVDNFLSEPKLENMEDNVLGLELGNHEKGLKIEDFPCPDDLCQLNTGSSNVAYAWVLFSNSPFFKVIWILVNILLHCLDQTCSDLDCGSDVCTPLAVHDPKSSGS